MSLGTARRWIWCCAVAALLPSCERNPTQAETGGLRLDVLVSRSSIGVGDTATILFRLRNLTADSVRITFGSSCHILPFVSGRDADDVVYPGGGGWACLAVVTHLALAPGGQEAISLLVRGSTTTGLVYPELQLAPGNYLAYATFAHPDYPLRSGYASIGVR